MELAVILHDIRSVHNVGSIFRTADAAGAAKIYLCGITPAPFDRLKTLRPDFAKVALGAHEYVAWESAKSTAAVIKQLKKEGYAVFAVEQSERSVPYYSVVPAPAARVALVLGNEVAGLPPRVLRLTDKVLEIPMSGKKESLNVAVAFGIVVFGLRRPVVRLKK
jgi:tRNA G18 (ribose-2'-O)-methylase SpoU